MLYIKGTDPQADDDYPIFVELIPSPDLPDERIALTYNDLVVVELCRYTGIIFRKPLPEDHEILPHIRTEQGRNGNLYIKVE